MSARNDLKLFKNLNYLAAQGLSDKDGKSFCLATISQAFFDASTKCTSSASVTTVTDLGCAPAGGYDYKKSKACVACRSLYDHALEERNKIETETAAKNTSYKAATKKETIWESADAVCRPFCTACVVEGLTQSASVSVSSSCASSEDFKTNMKNSMAAQIKSYLTDNADQLKKGYEMELGDTSNDDVSAKMTETLYQFYQQNIEASLVSGVVTFQRLQIQRGSESILAQNITQAITVSVVESLVVRAAGSLDIYSEADLNAAIPPGEKVNDTVTGTLGDTTRSFEELASKLWDTIGGKLVMVGAGLAVVVLLVVIGYFVITAK